MKPIIGIIMRKSLSESHKNILIIYDDLVNAIINSGGIPIGIDNKNINLYLNICHGFILQGGDDIDNDNMKVIKLSKEKNIPLLGICLGMQEMAYYDCGVIIDISNHQDNFHEVNINKDSKLYNIMNDDKIIVNSRHKSAVIKTNLNISAVSNDNIIEAIEDNNKLFYIGLQWHPESMYEYNLNAKNIFDYFLKMCHY